MQPENKDVQIMWDIIYFEAQATVLSEMGKQLGLYWKVNLRCDYYKSLFIILFIPGAETQLLAMHLFLESMFSSRCDEDTITCEFNVISQVDFVVDW